MEKVLEYNIQGLKCDNPDCDWQDMSIPLEAYVDYINHKCPKCGDVTLTEECFNDVQRAIAFCDDVNKIALEQLEGLKEQFGRELTEQEIALFQQKLRESFNLDIQFTTE